VIAKPFRRRPPPLPVRCLAGVWIHGVVAPLVYVFERLGVTERVLRNAHAQQQKQLARKNPFKSYVPNEHDVFVATYAKSGTNWMMQIVHQLLFHGKGEFEHIHDVAPWPDSPAPLGKYAIPVEDPSVWMASPEKKRVIKTHLNWELIPYAGSARYIAVIRDPKDVFVSNYFFAKALGGAAIPRLETWYRMFVSESFLLGGSWAVNAAGYWAQRHRPNVLVLSFKSMKRDLAGTVRRVAEFLDVRVGDEVLESVCAQAGFAYMKGIDSKFAVWKMTPWSSPGTMVRKGLQGGSSELLSVEQQRHIDQYFMEELQRLGCDLPYDEFCDLAP
jgi:aryl sulfotransferase